MNVAVVLIAATSVPLGLYSLFTYLRDDRVKGIFGMAAAAWSIAGVLLISVGVPGFVFFPGLLIIMLAGSSVGLARRWSRVLAIRTAALGCFLVLISVGLVLL